MSGIMMMASFIIVTGWSFGAFLMCHVCTRFTTIHLRNICWSQSLLHVWQISLIIVSDWLQNMDNEHQWKAWRRMQRRRRSDLWERRSELCVETEPLVIEANFCRRSMAVLYKTTAMLFFCGTFSYFMANEPQPLSVLEALTYQVQFTPQNPIQSNINSRGWFCFVFTL